MKRFKKLIKRGDIFKIEYSNTPPVYVFTRHSWCGIASNLTLRKDKYGTITPITYWKFIKEWLNGNKRT